MLSNFELPESAAPARKYTVCCCGYFFNLSKASAEFMDGKRRMSGDF